VYAVRAGTPARKETLAEKKARHRVPCAEKPKAWVRCAAAIAGLAGGVSRARIDAWCCARAGLLKKKLGKRDGSIRRRKDPSRRWRHTPRALSNESQETRFRSSRRFELCEFGVPLFPASPAAGTGTDGVTFAGVQETLAGGKTANSFLVPEDSR